MLELVETDGVKVKSLSMFGAQVGDITVMVILFLIIVILALTIIVLVLYIWKMKSRNCK